MRLALGTANLGQRYGISNESQVTEAEAIEIIQLAYQLGFRDFDTAPEYGVAEELVGKSLYGFEKKIQIKVPSAAGSDLNSIRKTIVNSLKNLKIEKAETVLFHDPDFYRSDIFPQIVESIINEGFSANVGLSCYSAEDVIRSHSRCNLVNTFQVPENILDRRILANPDILKLSEEGCKFQVRSAFLQGLLLINPNQLPQNLSSCRESIKQLNDFVISNNLKMIQLLISYAMQIKWADSIVVGANSIQQLMEIVTSEKNLVKVDWEQFQSIPEPYIDPRSWHE